LAQTGFSLIPPRRRELRLSSPLSPLPLSSQVYGKKDRKKKKKKTRKPLHSRGRHCGKQNVRRKQTHGGPGMVFSSSSLSNPLPSAEDWENFRAGGFFSFSSSRSFEMVDDGGRKKCVRWDPRSFIPNLSYVFVRKCALLCPPSSTTVCSLAGTT